MRKFDCLLSIIIIIGWSRKTKAEDKSQDVERPPLYVQIISCHVERCLEKLNPFGSKCNLWEGLKNCMVDLNCPSYRIDGYLSGVDCEGMPTGPACKDISRLDACILAGINTVKNNCQVRDGGWNAVVHCFQNADCPESVTQELKGVFTFFRKTCEGKGEGEEIDVDNDNNDHSRRRTETTAVAHPKVQIKTSRMNDRRSKVHSISANTSPSAIGCLIAVSIAGYSLYYFSPIELVY